MLRFDTIVYMARSLQWTIAAGAANFSVAMLVRGSYPRMLATPAPKRFACSGLQALHRPVLFKELVAHRRHRCAANTLDQQK